MRTIASFALQHAPKTPPTESEKLMVLLLLGGMFLFLIVVVVVVVRGIMKPVDFPLLLGEQVMQTYPASRWAGLITIGGWLRLTNQRFVFVPHRSNIGKPQPLAIEWSQVRNAGFGTTAKELAFKAVAAAAHVHASSSTLHVEHANGTDRFVVFESPELLSNLQAHIQRGRTAPR